MAENLPPEIAKQISPEWRKNEAAYWDARDALLAQYSGQWIAYADDQVIASGTSPVDVLHRAQESDRHPFVVCVGHEDEPTRMRRTTFAYDQSYPNEALPVIEVEFRRRAEEAGLLLDRVIPDTGADASVLPWADCQALRFDPSEGTPGLIAGIAQVSSTTLVFPAWVRLDGKDYECRLQADFTGNERILGRDVFNRIDVLFRGPAAEVVINPVKQELA